MDMDMDTIAIRHRHHRLAHRRLARRPIHRFLVPMARRVHVARGQPVRRVGQVPLVRQA